MKPNQKASRHHWIYYPRVSEGNHLSHSLTITLCDSTLPSGAIIHVATVSNQADIKRLDALRRAGCMSFLACVIYSPQEVWWLYTELYSCSQKQIKLNSTQSALHTSSCKSNRKDKTPVHAAHSSVLGVCPYLTMMVNILTFLAKGDRRRKGGREDRFLRM